MVDLAAGLRLAVQDQDGTDPPVVLLHGLASTHRWWDLVTTQLPGRRVVRWDHRGHGLSSPSPETFGIDTLAGDAAMLLDRLRLDRCVVAGHSMGASVALQLAADRPDLVAAVCCIDGGLPDPKIMFGPDWATARTAMCIERRTAPTPAILGVWARGNGLPDIALSAVLANYHPTQRPSGRLLLTLPPRYETALAHSIWHHNPGAVLAQITVPVLAVMAQTGDPAQRGRRQRALHRTVGSSARQVLEVWIDGGHELPLQQPRPVAEAITGLIDQTEDRA